MPMNPPDELLVAAVHHSSYAEPARTFVSLLLRPIVCPEVPGICPRKTMEVRFFAPGSLVSNLDFVESIFGNAGDPVPAANDAGLDVEHWTGHTGCVILAPHLVQADQEATWPAALRPGHRTAAARRHVLEGRGRTIQRRRSLQSHLPHRRRASSSPSSPTTITATARRK